MTTVFLLITCIVFGFTIFDANCIDSSLPRIETRIISGSIAEPGQFPWQVLLKRDIGDDIYCGGTIISADYILTSAHCTKNFTSVYLSFGVTNLRDTPEISLTSTEIYKHNDYVPKFITNDISIVKLPEPLTFSDKIKPVTLLSRSDAEDSFVGKPVTIYGWGYTSDTELHFSEDLLLATLTVITNDKCKEKYDVRYIQETNICAIGSEDRLESICHGDSGGALLFEKSPGNFIQIGINSFVADEICAEGDPAGFVRLGSFLDFIQNITNIVIT